MNPKRYQVMFMAAEPDPAEVRKLAAARPSHRSSSSSSAELYAWHPEGIGRSRLWTRLAGRGLGVTATARNWTTVTNLLAIADE